MNDKHELYEAQLKQATDCESWYKTRCPYCTAINWFSNGNESDLSRIDVDSIQCHSCGKVYWFGPPFEDQTEPENTAEGIIMKRLTDV